MNAPKEEALMRTAGQVLVALCNHTRGAFQFSGLVKDESDTNCFTVVKKTMPPNLDMLCVEATLPANALHSRVSYGIHARTHTLYHSPPLLRL